MVFLRSGENNQKFVNVTQPKHQGLATVYKSTVIWCLLNCLFTFRLFRLWHHYLKNYKNESTGVCVVYMHGWGSYLEAVLDVVSRLPYAYRLQHASVAQLPQDQLVVEAQRQLGKIVTRRGELLKTRECGLIRGLNKPIKSLTNKVTNWSSIYLYLLSVGADTLDKVGLGVAQGFH